MAAWFDSKSNLIPLHSIPCKTNQFCTTPVRVLFISHLSYHMICYRDRIPIWKQTSCLMQENMNNVLIQFIHLIAKHMVHDLLCFVMVGYWSTWYIFFGITSLTLGQSYSASAATLKNRGKCIIWIHNNWWYNHKEQSTTKPCIYFFFFFFGGGIHCIHLSISFTMSFISMCHIKGNSGYGLSYGRRRYNVTSSFIGWAHPLNDPCIWQQQWYVSLYIIRQRARMSFTGNVCIHFLFEF